MNNQPPGGQFPQGYPQGYPPQQQYPQAYTPQQQAALNLQQQGMHRPGYPVQQQQQGYNPALPAYAQPMMQQQSQPQQHPQQMMRAHSGSPAPSPTPAQPMQAQPQQYQPQQPAPSILASSTSASEAPNVKKRRLEDITSAATPSSTPPSTPASTPAPAGPAAGQGPSAGPAAAGTSNPASLMMPPPPPRKRTEDDTWVLPRRGVQLALKAAGLDKDFKIEPSMEMHSTLMELYGSLIENAVQFGCANAQLRKSAVLKPRDMAVYLERNWNIHVPGFAGEQLRPHRRPAASDVHRKRLLASRQTQNEAAAVADGATDGAGKEGGK